MSVLSNKEYEFLNVEIGGVSYPPSPVEIITPEVEDPFWEINYRDGTSIFATGNVMIAAKLKELTVIEGGIQEEAELKGRSRVRKLHGDKKEEKEEPQ